MKRRHTAVLMVLLFGAVAMGPIAMGDFNAATGFSGRHGFTCTSCHNVPDMGPAGDEQIYDPPAEVTLTGLPEEWELRQDYELTITVTGGPPALPSPAPQGGFEVEADGGRFLYADGMQDFTHVYADDEKAVTYTEEGTQMREWKVLWRAPDLPPAPNAEIRFPDQWDPLRSAPTDITFWVAAMAANGNHLRMGVGDGGEFGDSVDNITVTIPPSQAAVDAWQEYRLLPAWPDADLDNEPLEVDAFAPFTITGKQLDEDATHVAYSLDGGPWERKAATSTWTIPFGNGLTPGDHSLLIRAESEDRVSEPVEIIIHALDPSGGEVATPFPTLLAVGGLLMAVGWRRRQ